MFMKFVDLSKLRSLEELIYEKVKVMTTEGKIYEGEFTSYSSAYDNDDGLESIGMKYEDHIESFDITFIKSIEIIEESEEVVKTRLALISEQLKKHDAAFVAQVFNLSENALNALVAQ